MKQLYHLSISCHSATLFRDEGEWLEPGAAHELRMAIQSDPNDGSVHARN